MFRNKNERKTDIEVRLCNKHDFKKLSSKNYSRNNSSKMMNQEKNNKILTIKIEKINQINRDLQTE